MQCTLLIPHLLLPGEVGDNACRGLALRALEKFLARASRLSFPPIGMEAWLCQAFEVEKQRDWPVAPLTLAVDGRDTGTDYWLRADPVHLQLQRNELRLVGSEQLAITQFEADGFVTALNRHFVSEEMQFLAPSPRRWYLRLPREPMLATSPLSEVIGTDVRAHLPAGNDARSWHGRLNEIQMILHQHENNSRREAEGALSVNSIWLWGGGRKPSIPGHHFCAVWGENTLASALATAAGIDAAPLPHDGLQWVQAAQSSSPAGLEHLIVMENLQTAARNGDIASWRDEVSTLNDNWLSPLLDLLGKSLSRIAMVLPAIESCERFELSPSAMRRFWRTSKPVSAYAARHTKS